MMPKINVNPTPRKNSSAACENALAHCVTRNGKRSIGVNSVVVDHLVARRRHSIGWIGSDNLGYRVRHALALDNLDDEPLLLALMVAGSHDDAAFDAVHLQTFQRSAQLGGLNAP